MFAFDKTSHIFIPSNIPWEIIASLAFRIKKKYLSALSCRNDKKVEFCFYYTNTMVKDSTAMENLGEINNPVEVDNIALKRVLRRRKILENAKSRLEKLNGRVLGGDHMTVETDQESPAQFSDPEVEPNVIGFMNSMSTDEMDANMNEWMNETSHADNNNFLKYRIHILLATVIAFIISFLWSARFSVFIPVGICIVVEMLFFQKQKEINPVVSVVLALSKIEPKKAKSLIHVIYIAQNLLYDIAIMIFVFCSLSYILNCLSDRYTLLVDIK